MPRLPASMRGRLGEAIDDAIEGELSRRDSPPPGIGADADTGARLSDQLFRARKTGATRLAVTLPSLAPLASVAGALGSEDGATLLFWSEATRERPVDLHLLAEDLALSAHVRPTPLRMILGEQQEPAERCLERAPLVEEPVALEAPPEPATVPEPLPPPSPSPSPPSPSIEEPHDDWRTATLALTAARGPQPLAALERLFAESYLPLDTGLREPSRKHDPRAVHARDEFKASFSRVYVEAFHTFAVTGKRPKMVLDAPDVAARMARHTSARTTQLLLVDGLRYDLGTLVKEELEQRLEGKAVLAQELLLWSALPTTTTHQLTTLVRGVSALEMPDEESEPSVVRGRTADTIRRVKIGSRDLYRLDLCDARVREAKESALPSFSEIAAQVATVIGRHAETLAPRTLLFVFGDHGFTFDRGGVASHGGASPEEVLVPAFALLVGDVH